MICLRLARRRLRERRGGSKRSGFLLVDEPPLGRKGHLAANPRSFVRAGVHSPSLPFSKGLTVGSQDLTEWVSPSTVLDDATFTAMPCMHGANGAQHAESAASLSLRVRQCAAHLPLQPHRNRVSFPFGPWPLIHPDHPCRPRCPVSASFRPRVRSLPRSACSVLPRSAPVSSPPHPARAALRPTGSSVALMCE